VTAYPITAYNLSNALGDGVAEVRQALFEGRSGLGPPPPGFFEDSIALYCGRLDVEFEPLPEAWSSYDIRQSRMTRHILAPIEDAVRAAVERWGGDRVAAVQGTSTGGIRGAEQAFFYNKEHGHTPDDFDIERQHALHAATEAMAGDVGITGPVWVVSTACSSSGKVFASAKRLLDMGLVDAVLVGGVDTLCHTTLRGFHSLGLLADEPCRPFSAERRGINLGEGGAMLLLEREGSGPAWLLGVGESCDAYHMTAPHPDGAGALAAMQQALVMAGVQAGEISHINAHGTGTPLNDPAESKAIQTLFGTRVPVVASKAYTGHTLGAAGATEAALSVLAIDEGWVPASLYSTPRDPEVKINVLTERTELESRFVLSNSFAFGGNNVSVLFGSAAEGEARALKTEALAGADLEMRLAAVSTWIEEDGQPDLSLLQGRARRRASPLTRVAAHVLKSLCDEAGVDPSSLPTIYTSDFGEMQTTVHLMGMMTEDDGSLSPTWFSNSVHNAASGHLSIAVGSKAFSTAVAGGPGSVAIALVEAAGLLAAGAEQVAVLAIELPLVAPFEAYDYRGLGGGLLLTRDRGRRLVNLRRAPANKADLLPAALSIPESLHDNPCVPAYALAQAFKENWRGSLPLTVPREKTAQSWWIDFE